MIKEGGGYRILLHLARLSSEYLKYGSVAKIRYVVIRPREPSEYVVLCCIDCVICQCACLSE